MTALRSQSKADDSIRRQQFAMEKLAEQEDLKKQRNKEIQERFKKARKQVEELEKDRLKEVVLHYEMRKLKKEDLMTLRQR